jgi:hypothetical protein
MTSFQAPLTDYLFSPIRPPIRQALAANALQSNISALGIAGSPIVMFEIKLAYVSP